LLGVQAGVLQGRYEQRDVHAVRVWESFLTAEHKRIAVRPLRGRLVRRDSFFGIKLFNMPY